MRMRHSCAIEPELCANRLRRRAVVGLGAGAALAALQPAWATDRRPPMAIADLPRLPQATARGERLLWSLDHNIGVFSGIEVALRRF